MAHYFPNVGAICPLALFAFPITVYVRILYETSGASNVLFKENIDLTRAYFMHDLNVSDSLECW